jgi:hypothetical protein
MDVSKEKFDAVYNKYAPSKFLKFVYTHYNVNLKRKPTPVGTLLAVIGWVVGTLGLIVFDQLGMKEVSLKFLWAYLPFASLIISLPAFLLSQKRIKKIAKELGITLEKYNQLVALYYPKG